MATDLGWAKGGNDVAEVRGGGLFGAIALGAVEVHGSGHFGRLSGDGRGFCGLDHGLVDALGGGEHADEVGDGHFWCRVEFGVER